MAISAAVTVADGPGAASASLSGNATVIVTPGNTITVALNSTTSVTKWSCRVDSTDLPVIGGLQIDQVATFSFSFTAPPGTGNIYFSSEVTDGQNVAQTKFVVQVQSVSALPDRSVRGLAATSNITTITAASAFTVAGPDGVTFVQGDRVLVTNQTTKKENGIYVVGAVATGTATLTRPPDYATGMVLPLGLVIEMNAGTLFANTSWKITTAGAITVDTTSHDIFVRTVSQVVTLVTGFATVTNVPVLSTTKSAIMFQPTNFNGATSTVSYRTGAYTNGGAATAAGVIGTGSVSITALVAAGTFNTSDVGTGLLTITNW